METEGNSSQEFVEGREQKREPEAEEQDQRAGCTGDDMNVPT